MTEQRTEGFGETFRLALPMGLAFAGEQCLGLVDTLVAGHLGPTQLAATGLSNALFMSALILAIGTLSGLETLTAQARGRGEIGFVGRMIRSRNLVSWGLTPLVILVSELFLWLYFWMADLNPELQSEMRHYLLARYLCIPFVLHANITRSLLQAFEDPTAVFRSMVFVNLLNIPLNLYLATHIEFELGFMTVSGLGLGVVGLGLSTSAVALFRAVYLSAQFQKHVQAAREAMYAEDLKRLIKVGLPIGIHWLSEMSIFSVVGLMAGHLGVEQAAAHQIAMTLASFTFTLCLGLSAAGTVRVGLAVGENKPDMARREGNRTVLLGLLLMGISAITLFITREHLASLFSTDPAVLQLAISLIAIASTFQLVDGVQAVMAGNLRGLGATRWALFCSAFGYWCVGFPAAWYWSQTAQTVGLWWGLVVGLFVSASLLTFGFYRNLKPVPFSKLRALLN